jgi:hypothetical protein
MRDANTTKKPWRPGGDMAFVFMAAETSETGSPASPASRRAPGAPPRKPVRAAYTGMFIIS